MAYQTLAFPVNLLLVAAILTQPMGLARAGLPAPMASSAAPTAGPSHQPEAAGSTLRNAHVLVSWRTHSQPRHPIGQPFCMGGPLSEGLWDDTDKLEGESSRGVVATVREKRADGEPLGKVQAAFGRFSLSARQRCICLSRLIL